MMDTSSNRCCSIGMLVFEGVPSTLPTGGFNTTWKVWVKLDHFPQNRGKHESPSNTYHVVYGTCPLGQAEFRMEKSPNNKDAYTPED